MFRHLAKQLSADSPTAEFRAHADVDYRRVGHVARDIELAPAVPMDPVMPVCPCGPARAFHRCWNCPELQDQLIPGDRRILGEGFLPGPRCECVDDVLLCIRGRCKIEGEYLEIVRFHRALLRDQG